jgi:succinate dehydrogenase / fumarate reductase flavoprotein subunit
MRQANARRGINGANRLGGNSLSDLIVFGKRAGEYAAQFAKENSHGSVSSEQIEVEARRALEPFEREQGENAFNIQHDLQDMMQRNVGIVRNEGEMEEAVSELQKLKSRAEKCSVTGNIDFNPGWHTALDLKNLLTVSEAIALAALERKESRGGHFREDYPNKETEFSKFNFSLKQDADGQMQISRIPIPEMPAELKQVIEEMG